MGGMRPHPGNYFGSIEEADAWLPFDSDEEEIELFAWRENDRFHEWQKWRADAD